MANCDPASLIQASKCLRCIPPGMMGAVKTWLLCNVTLCPRPTLPNRTAVYSSNQLDHIIIDNAGGDDVGGFWQLYGVAGGISTLVVQVPVVVANVTAFTAPNFAGAYDSFYVVEIGNGVDFCGVSNPSGSFAKTLVYPTQDIILADDSGGFWKLVVSTSGDVGTVSDAGPATGPWVLFDGTGWWRLVADNQGNRGTTPDAGPATVPVPTLTDPALNVWTLVTDSFGDLGATL